MMMLDNYCHIRLVTITGLLLLSQTTLALTTLTYSGGGGGERKGGYVVTTSARVGRNKVVSKVIRSAALTPDDEVRQPGNNNNRRRNLRPCWVSRRDAIIAFGVVSGSKAARIIPPAYASGGATAGGVYLLSAKQRYNQRVEAGIKSFLGLSTAVEGGDLGTIKDYFDDDGEGSWKDLATAGYLLANAFRRSSNTPPDSLPAVKKWKAFKAGVDGLEKAAKKKSKTEAQSSYAQAEGALDDYLQEIEFPPSIEMRK